jgi:hypothetical protein
MLHIINVRQSRETGNIGYTTRIKTKHIMCKNGHHYPQANTNKIYKTWTLPQTAGGIDESNILFCGNN